jgi:hypothetical protein
MSISLFAYFCFKTIIHNSVINTDPMPDYPSSNTSANEIAVIAELP